MLFATASGRDFPWPHPVNISDKHAAALYTAAPDYADFSSHA
jgi:hypothetical protein